MGVHEFYQVNTPAAELLYAKAQEFARLQPDDFLLDLYCGMGTIGLSMQAALHAAWSALRLCRRQWKVPRRPLLRILACPRTEADFYCHGRRRSRRPSLASRGCAPRCDRGGPAAQRLR